MILSKSFWLDVGNNCFARLPKIKHIMAKKSKLFAALDAHKGRDYQAEKQKKQHKQAEKRKRMKKVKAHEEEKENLTGSVNGAVPELQTESDGWESDESEAAQPTTVVPMNGFLLDSTSN